MTPERQGINPSEEEGQNVEYPFPDIPVRMKIMLMVNESRGFVTGLKMLHGQEFDQYRESILSALKRLTRWLSELEDVPGGLLDKVDQFRNLVESFSDNVSDQCADSIEAIGKEINDLLNAPPSESAFTIIKKMK